MKDKNSSGAFCSGVLCTIRENPGNISLSWGRHLQGELRTHAHTYMDTHT